MTEQYPNMNNLARSGQYVKQAQGYRAFVPRPLPPDPGVDIDSEMQDLLSSANLALGRLDGSSEIMPNPDLFVAMYVRKEAVLSSQIEGTQASLIDVLEYEANAGRQKIPNDVPEVINYVQAMNYGLERLDTLPLSNRLLREIHRELLTNVRGTELSPGSLDVLRTGLGRRDALSQRLLSSHLRRTIWKRLWEIWNAICTTTRQCRHS